MDLLASVFQHSNPRTTVSAGLKAQRGVYHLQKKTFSNCEDSINDSEHNVEEKTALLKSLMRVDNMMLLEKKFDAEFG